MNEITPKLTCRAPTRGLPVMLAGLSACVISITGCTAVSVGVSDGVPIEQIVTAGRSVSSQPYQLRPGDDVTVRFYYNPQLDEDLRVRPDGRISLSLVGELQAAGKRPDQLSADVTDAYSHYFVKSNAVVILRHSADDVVFVAGEVRNPGQFNIEQGARMVLDCLALSGGVTDSATLRSVILVRRSGDAQHPLVTELNLSRALSGSDAGQNIALAPGDLVYIPKSGLADTNLAIHLFLLNNLNLSTSGSAGFSHAF
jgi:protein involved in polysaccharide export with SLBB domain